MNSFIPKKTYKFVTLAPAVLGERFDMMKCIRTTIASDVVEYLDVHEVNRNLLSSIPGLPTNADDNLYVVFENADGERVVFAMEWIDNNSIKLVEGINIRIDIPNASTDDLFIVKNALMELGKKNLDIYTY